MNQAIVSHPDGVHFSVEPLKQDTVSVAADLCDRCVGKNLYPTEYLREICGRPEHFFFLLRTPEGKVAGYYYFQLTDLDGMAAFTKLDRQSLSGLCPADAVVANLRSIGILEDFRGGTLSLDLVGYFLNLLQTKLHADLAFCVCWKPQGRIPVNRSLDVFHFRHLTDVERFWEAVPDLECPCCDGPCQCAAAIYYLLLGGGNRV